MEHGSFIGQELASRKQRGTTALGNSIRAGHATLVLDRHGRILSCGEPAQQILNMGHASLIGRCIADFIAGLFLSGSSPSYSARHLVYLCSAGEWRRHQARDGHGMAFPVEVNLALMASSGPEREMFLLNLRRADS